MAAKAWGDAQWADVVGLGTFGVYGLDVCSRTRPNGLVFYGRAVLVAALVMWPLALLTGMHAGWVGALLWLSAVNELSGVLGGWLNGERRYDGPMGKSDRTLAWGLLCLFLGFEADVSEGLPIALCVVFLCLIWSTAIRIKKTVRP